MKQKFKKYRRKKELELLLDIIEENWPILTGICSVIVALFIVKILIKRAKRRAKARIRAEVRQRIRDAREKRELDEEE